MAIRKFTYKCNFCIKKFGDIKKRPYLCIVKQKEIVLPQAKEQPSNAGANDQVWQRKKSYFSFGFDAESNLHDLEILLS